MSEKLTNYIRISLGEAVIELLIKTGSILYWPINHSTLPTKTWKKFLTENMLKDSYIIFQNSVDNFEIS